MNALNVFILLKQHLHILYNLWVLG